MKAPAGPPHRNPRAAAGALMVPQVLSGIQLYFTGAARREGQGSRPARRAEVTASSRV
ncbi:hypothetical protein GCM10010187_28240 [Actinomadura coerulea]|nr:hypothetical protein GCM10010187_28240 [Actinomadura coerulea]